MYQIVHIVLSKGWHAQVANANLIIQQQLKNGDRVRVCTVKDGRLEVELRNIMPIKDLITLTNANSLRLISKLKPWVHLENVVFHLHGYRGKFPIWCAFRLFRKEVPLICSSREQIKDRFCFRFLFWSHITLIVTPTNAIREALKKRIPDSKLPMPPWIAPALKGLLGDAQPELRVIPPPVNAQKFKPDEGKKTPETVVGMVARYETVKGHFVFLRACKKITRRFTNLKIVIAGANFSSHWEEINQLIREFDLEDRTRIISRTNRIEDEINAMDIGVIASTGSEELSRALLEYMACGIPVVGTEVGCLPEAITPETGILVPPNDSTQLAEAIELLIENPELRNQMGCQARKKVEQENSVMIHCLELHKIYSEVIHPE
jgi:glycosyltransferase involved in cell wall biosynthesis